MTPDRTPRCVGMNYPEFFVSVNVCASRPRSLYVVIYVTVFWLEFGTVSLVEVIP